MLEDGRKLHHSQVTMQLCLVQAVRSIKNTTNNGCVKFIDIIVMQ